VSVFLSAKKEKMMEINSTVWLIAQGLGLVFLAIGGLYLTGLLAKSIEHYNVWLKRRLGETEKALYPLAKTPMGKAVYEQLGAWREQVNEPTDPLILTLFNYARHIGPWTDRILTPEEVAHIADMTLATFQKFWDAIPNNAIFPPVDKKSPTPADKAFLDMLSASNRPEPIVMKEGPKG
jgi:hypothetical protein